MNRSVFKFFEAAILFAFIAAAVGAESVYPVPTSAPISQALSVSDALNLALERNASILRGKADLEAAHGVVIQTRAIVIPKLRAGGTIRKTDPDAIESFSTQFGAGPISSDREWSASVRLVQSIYEGGRMSSALRTAKLTKEQSILNFQTVVADTMRDVRVAYDDVLLADQSIAVQEASVNLLTKELEDTGRRFAAGTVPRFNVLRAEVELANARPRLIRARNAYRISKNNLANLLGYDLPKSMGEDIPLQLTGKFFEDPFEVDLSSALQRAYENRTELASLRAAEKLRRENIVNARSGYKPSVQAFGGYGSRSSSFNNAWDRDITGWFIGAEMNWDIFDGMLTRGRVVEATAMQERAAVDLDDAARRIGLEVRTAHSSFIEARELLESQKKVQEQADEALRLARARVDAGSGTQLDVLSAQTALTEARTTRIQALRDYSVAKTQLDHAIGNSLQKK